ncbi:MAG: hypothetical protein E3J81_05865 [Dehalococcoidia bacterium]|nr:MAG: hypothetical protein E3J81_05865 [Dehalococcoidia bacterium]
MVEIINRKPRSYPVFGGSLPSTRGGRRSVVLAGVDQDGNWDIQSEDTGPEYGNDEPILFLPFGAIDYALSKDDLKEMLAGMRERHLSWRSQQPDLPDLTKAVKEFYSALLHYRDGRRQFSIKEGISGK